MKKVLLVMLILCAVYAFVPTSSAEYVVSMSFGDVRHSEYFDRGRHGCRFVAPFYSHHRRPYHRKTIVIKTYDAGQSEKTVISREKFGISDIIVLSHAGIPDNVIIEKIVKTGSVFNLSVEEVIVLKKEGVSNNVINFMLGTMKKK